MFTRVGAKMGLDDVREEVSILQSIFCQDDEFQMHTDLESLRDDQEYSITFSIYVNLNCEEAFEQEINSGDSLGPVGAFGSKQPSTTKSCVFTATLDSKYPKEVQNISLKSTNFTNSQLKEMKSELWKYLEQLLVENDGQQPIIMDLIQWTKDNHYKFLQQSSNSSSLVAQQRGDTQNAELSNCVVLKLDHMHSKQKYTKLIVKFANEFVLSGRLLFYGKMIWIILYGKSKNIKEYLKWHRTANVDVDSSGRPCKERMMTVLLEKEQELPEEM